MLIGQNHAVPMAIVQLQSARCLARTPQGVRLYCVRKVSCENFAICKWRAVIEAVKALLEREKAAAAKCDV